MNRHDRLARRTMGAVCLKRRELAVFSMSEARKRLSVYDVNEASDLIAKKMGREQDSLSGGFSDFAFGTD